MVRGMAPKKHVMISAQNILNLFGWISRCQYQRLRNANGFINVSTENMHDMFILVHAADHRFW